MYLQARQSVRNGHGLQIFEILQNHSTVALHEIRQTSAAMSSFIGSGKISKLYMMLSVLPLPPIPVKLRVDPLKITNAETRQALAVALNSLEGRAADPETVHNSHSVIAALTLFADWCDFGKENAETIKVTKDGLVLNMMKQGLNLGNGKADCSVSEHAAYDMFFDITRNWIACCVPEEAQCKLDRVDPGVPGQESALHVSMSHYCYSQGVLYSAKGGQLTCPTHDFVTKSFQEKVAAAREDSSSIEKREVDDESIRMEQQEMAEMYSKYCYRKLLSLCFTRIHRDSLLGHMVDADDNNKDVLQTAKALLDDAIETHRKVLREKNMKESFDNLQIAKVEPRDEVQVVNCVQDGDCHETSTDDSEDEVTRAVRSFILVAAQCLEKRANSDLWVALARNLEDFLYLYQADHADIYASCRVLSIDKVIDLFKQNVEGKSVSCPGMKRVDQALLDFVSARSGGETKTYTPSSHASELGIIIRGIAKDIPTGIATAREAANEMHALSENQSVKDAAEIFGVLGVKETPAGKARVEVVE